MNTPTVIHQKPETKRPKRLKARKHAGFGIRAEVYLMEYQRQQINDLIDAGVFDSCGNSRIALSALIDAGLREYRHLYREELAVHKASQKQEAA